MMQHSETSCTFWVWSGDVLKKSVSWFPNWMPKEQKLESKMAKVSKSFRCWHRSNVAEWMCTFLCLKIGFDTAEIEAGQVCCMIRALVPWLGSVSVFASPPTPHTHTHTSLPLPIKATIATFGIFSAFISFVFHNVYGVVLIFRKFKMKMLGLEIAAPPIAIVQLLFVFGTRFRL